MVKIKKNKYYIVLIILLLTIIFTLFVEYKNLKIDDYLTKIHPRYDLKNETALNTNLYLDIFGFVSFTNIEEQPRNLKQYYKIKGSNEK